MSLYNTVPSVMPSGRGIYFPFPSPVTKLAFPGEEQSLTISVHPSTVNLTSFTLTFNGQTTAPIPISIIAPPTYFEWRHTLSATGTFDLAVNLFIGGTGSRNMTYEIFDGPNKLGTVVLDSRFATGNPAPFNDPTLVCYGSGTGDGGPVQWWPLGRFIFTTTNMKVRVSCPDGGPNDVNTVTANDLRIADPTGTSVTKLTNSIPPNFGAGYSLENFFKQVYGDPQWLTLTGTWAGDRYSVDPAAVQAALQALSNIGTGNIQCTGNGTVATSLKFTFINQLANVAQNLLSTNNPTNISIARVAIGGSWPKIKINGVSPTSSSYEYWLPHGGMSAIAFFFISDMASVRYQSVNNHSNPVSGPWSNYLDDLGGAPGGGYTPTLYRSEGTGATATFTENPLTAGTYRISGTWPANAAWSPDVIFTLKNAAGTVLWTYHVNQTHAPSGSGGGIWEVFGTATITQVMGDGLILTQSNNTSTAMIADTVRFERTSSNIEVKINAGDVVTYTTQDNWVTTTDGPVLGVIDQPLLNLVGKTLFPNLESTQTMGVGLNVTPNASNVSSTLYTNLLKAGVGLSGASFDSLGYPTSVSFYRSFNLVIFPKVSWQADNKTWPVMLPGDYVVVWDGDSTTDVSIGSAGGTNSVVEYTDRKVITNTTNNRKYYKFDGNGWGVDLSLTISTLNPDSHGVGPVNAKNIRIFKTPIDINNPPKYNPTFVNRIANKRVLRFMDFFGTIEGCPVTYEDINRPQGQPGTNDLPVRTISVGIAKIQQYTGNTFHFLSSAVPYQITTTSPHGLSDGQPVFIQNYTGPVSQISGTAGTSTYDFSAVAGCFVIDSTNFVIAPGPNGYGTMTNGPIINPGGQVFCQVFCCALQDAVEMCNLAGADFYFNSAATLTQDALTKVGAYIAANLNPGLKVYHEATNEPWNFFGFVFAWCATASVAYGLSNSPNDYISYYCQLAKKHWQWVREGMGVRANTDHIRVMGSLHAFSGVTQSYTQYCLAQNPPIVFDAIAVAPYYHNVPSGATYDNSYGTLEDHLNIEQCLDLQEMFWINTSYQYEVPSHKAALIAGGLPSNNNIKIIGYEGGPEAAIPPGNITARQGERQHGVLRHPRYWPFIMNSFKIYQNSGMEFFTIFQMTGQDGQFAWPIYQGTEQLDYQPGNSAQDLVQINNFDNLSLAGARSVVGGAAASWMNLVNKNGGGSVIPNSYTVLPPINSIMRIPTQIVVIFGQILTQPTTVNVSDGLVSGSVTVNTGEIYGLIPYTPTSAGDKTLVVSHTGQSLTDPTTDLTFSVISNSVSFVEPENFLENGSGRKFRGYDGGGVSDEV